MMSLDRELKIALAATSFVSLITGSAGTYFMMHKQIENKLQEQYDRHLKQEIADTKVFYARMHKTGGFADPEELATELNLDVATEAAVLAEDNIMVEAITALRDYKGTAAELPIDPVEATTELRNIFRDAKPLKIEALPDGEEEDPTVPYIITKEQYNSNDTEYDQLTFTYYVNDDTLANESDEMIEDTDEIVGEGNLQRFGYKSEDNNVVYIRNDRLSSDIEILRSFGSYVQEVLGFIEHAEPRPVVRRFRGDHE